MKDYRYEHRNGHRHRHRHGNKAKTEKIIGIALGVVGLLIVLNTMPVRFLLLLVGIALLLMGALIFMK